MKKIKLINPESPEFKQFFKNCSIVTSAPNVFFYVGEHMVLKGTPALVQAMPTRVYIGLCDCTDSQRGIEIVVGKRKEPYGLGINESYIGIREVESYIRGHWHNRYEFEKCIKVWSDIQPGSGANWSGAYSTALALAAYLDVVEEKGEISRFLDNLHDIRENGKSFKNLIEKDNRFKKTFNDVNGLAFFLESLFHGGSASGYGTFISLIGAKYPILYKTPKRWNNRPPYINIWRYNNNIIPVLPNDINTLMNNVFENILYRTQISSINGSSLFYNSNRVLVIDTGVRKHSTAQSIESIYDTLLSDLRNLFEIINKEKVALSEITFNFDEILELRQILMGNTIENFTLNIDAFIWLTIMHLQKFLANPQINSKDVKKFYIYMNAVGRTLESLNLGWNHLCNIKHALMCKLSDRPINLSDRVAVKLSGGGTAGVVTVVIYKHSKEYKYLESLLKENFNGNENYIILFDSDSEKDVKSIKGVEVEKREV